MKYLIFIIQGNHKKKIYIYIYFYTFRDLKQVYVISNDV